MKTVLKPTIWIRAQLRNALQTDPPWLIPRRVFFAYQMVNRNQLGVPKIHALDAACLGSLTAIKAWQRQLPEKPTGQVWISAKLSHVQQCCAMIPAG